MAYTTRSKSKTTDNPLPAPVNNNPISTANVIMAISEADRLAAAAATAAAAAAAVATANAAAAAAAASAATSGGNPMSLGSKLTDVEVTAFFKDKDNMNCVTDDAVKALIDEGISIPEDLIDFEDDDIDNMARNLGKIPSPDTVRLSAICVKRLKIAAACARFYKSIGRDLSKSNMSYNVMSVFWKQWQALTSQKKDKDKAVFPKMDRNTSILKWTEAAFNSFGSTIGSRNAPLSYVLRRDVECPDPLPTLSVGKPWSEVYGSIRNEMEFCLDHDHPVFDDDNKAIFDLLHDSLQGTAFGATINPHKKKKDGRKAWYAIQRQYAGKDRWDAEVKRETAFLTSMIWKGNGNITLAKHANKHRYAYISLETCALHVDYQLPNERTRVKYLLDSIRGCNDPGVQARIANIEGDDSSTGKRNQFEDSVTHLLPADPVVENNKNRRSREGNKQTVIAGVTIQSGKGKSGVDLRWHPMKEYKSLSDDQRDELKAWRNSNEGKAAIASSKKKYLDKKRKSGSDNDNSSQTNRRVKFKRMIASVVSETIATQNKTSTDGDAQVNALATSLFSNMKLPTQPAPVTASSVNAAAGPDLQKVSNRLVQLMAASGGK
jgi:hypothetical protein